MIYPDNFEKKIGFDIVRREVKALCTGHPGREAADDGLTFKTDARAVRKSLDETAEMLSIINGDEALPLPTITDLGAVLARAKAEGTFLAAEEFVQVATALSGAADIIAWFAARRPDEEGAKTPYPELDFLSTELFAFPQLLASINGAIDRYGEVKDSASPELAQIRRQLQQTVASLSSVMRRVIASGIASGTLEADTAAVMRDGRLVVPVSPANKRRLPGIVHDESASGKTFYIEPAEMVEANNRVRELQMEERREITRILRQLTDMLRPNISDIMTTVGVLGIFDFIHAKARYAARIGACMPHISDTSELEWYHASHPVLAETLAAHGKEVVPLDIRLTPDTRMLVISGPNAGGKSVCLKTVGIVQYMTQCGLLPPVYENSHIGLFDSIFIDIGDDQSIEDDLSTYSSHLRNMKAFLRNGNARTIALIDEFGAGTEPQIGGAIAQAILKEFNDKGMWGVITTHYQNLKTFAEETPGLVNGSMLYDRRLMQPLFKLSIGNAGSSFALEIARKTGLPESVISLAGDIVGSDYLKMDRYLLDIARDRRYWQNKRDAVKLKEKKVDEVLGRYEQEADELRSRRREILADAKQQASRIIDESNAQVERTIREIRNAQADRERTRAARQRLADERRALEETSRKAELEPETLRRAPKAKKQKAPEAPKPRLQELQAGDHVKLEGQSTVGTILEIRGKNATVSFGAIKTNVALDRLRPTIAKPASGAKSSAFVSSATSDANRERQLNFKQDIDVRGMRVDEALQAVTYFIDDATQFSAGRVRILHGTGTGALRQAIRDYLASVPSVASARDEHVQFGGAGITVVDLH